MNPKILYDLFDQLADCERKQALDQACRLIADIFNRLLKGVYARVRGQAPARIMRDLMQLEIEIGGEDGDFRTFDPHQMIDLFKRGRVGEHMQTTAEEGPWLSAAVDPDAIGRWLVTADRMPNAISPAEVSFLHRWLALLAREAGIVDPAHTAGTQRPLTDSSPSVAGGRLPQPGEPFTEPVAGIPFVFIPGGTFSMGDTFGEGADDEKPVHAVTLSPYYMAICPVTQAQWKKLMPDNPSGFLNDRHPVEQVAFQDLTDFINQLNAASPAGLTFHLPSEAQWEFAARSGGLDELYAGGGTPETVAWIESNSDGGSAAVCTRQPNGLGLYDMSGNVWEWCRDIYNPSAYRHHTAIDPVCTDGGRDRVIRGGSWHLDAWSARCSRRFCFDPEMFGPALGFRLVMTVTP